jgi:hypothetical protein
MAGSCECGNEPSSSIKCGEILDRLRNCLLSFQEGLCSSEPSSSYSSSSLGATTSIVECFGLLNI